MQPAVRSAVVKYCTTAIITRAVHAALLRTREEGGESTNQRKKRQMRGEYVRWPAIQLCLALHRPTQGGSVTTVNVVRPA